MRLQSLEGVLFRQYASAPLTGLLHTIGNILRLGCKEVLSAIGKSNVCSLIIQRLAAAKVGKKIAHLLGVETVEQSLGH